MRPHPVRSYTRTRQLTLLLNLTCLALVLLAADHARALPRYTARYGQSCTLCHTNPTGGGMRNAYAGQYLVPREMAAQPAPDQVSQTFTPQLTPNIAVGVDLRTLVYQEEEGSGEVDETRHDGRLGLLVAQELTMTLRRGLNLRAAYTHQDPFRPGIRGPRPATG